MPEQARPNNRKTATGIVISNKMQKTIVVRIERRMAHPVYKKVMTKASKFKVHDEKNEFKIENPVDFENFENFEDIGGLDKEQFFDEELPEKLDQIEDIESI